MNGLVCGHQLHRAPPSPVGHLSVETHGPVPSRVAYAATGVPLAERERATS